MTASKPEVVAYLKTVKKGSYAGNSIACSGPAPRDLNTDLFSGEDLIRLTDHEAARAADKARIAELEAERADLIRDKARLDFLDRMNAALNQRYGTSYKWRLVLSPNVVRLMTGMQNNGYVGDVDLNDSNANGEQSCRNAIDEALSQQGKEGEA